MAKANFKANFKAWSHIMPASKKEEREIIKILKNSNPESEIYADTRKRFLTGIANLVCNGFEFYKHQIPENEFEDLRQETILWSIGFMDDVFCNYAGRNLPSTYLKYQLLLRIERLLVKNDKNNNHALQGKKLENMIDEKSLSPDLIIERKESKAMLGKLLPSKEEQVTCYWFGLMDSSSYTLANIGEILNVTKERVRQLRNSAVERLSTNKNKEYFALC